MSQKMADQKVETEDMCRDDFTELFVDVLKLCQPEHPYKDVQYDHITTDSIIEGYCRSDSNYYARCGPRSSIGYIAKYSIDLNYFQKCSIERVLAITVHEATHITVGRHSQSGQSAIHPPEFWNTMAYHTQMVLDNISQIEDEWGKIDYKKFRDEIVNDPNSSMVDRRVESVSEVKNRLSQWVGEYPANSP